MKVIGSKIIYVKNVKSVIYLDILLKVYGNMDTFMILSIMKKLIKKILYLKMIKKIFMKDNLKLQIHH